MARALWAAALLIATPALAQPAADMTPPSSFAHAGHRELPAAVQAAPEPDTAPPLPTDHAADAVYGTEAMARARDGLRAEHGGGSFSMVLFDLAELQFDKGKAIFRWDTEAWFGGDIDRLVFKSEGEGGFGRAVEEAELQVLWSHAIGPYVNLQAGARYDFRPSPQRSYAVFGIEGLAPYWLEVEAHAFLSDQGDLLARFKAEHDMRITQRLILQPRFETNFSAQSNRAQGLGHGITDVELGLRLRYEIAREFAPYVGIAHEQRVGRTADYARLAGERRQATRFVAGVRAWF